MADIKVVAKYNPRKNTYSIVIKGRVSEGVRNWIKDETIKTFKAVNAASGSGVVMVDYKTEFMHHCSANDNHIKKSDLCRVGFTKEDN